MHPTYVIPKMLRFSQKAIASKRLTVRCITTLSTLQVVSFVPKARGYFESCESILNILYPSHVPKSINGLALRLLGRNLDLGAKNILVNLQFFVK